MKDFSLYRAALAADDVFSAMLVRAYGAQACNRRYQTLPHADASIAAAQAVKLTADIAWLTEMRREEETTT
jgi:hypothetical protein